MSHNKSIKERGKVFSPAEVDHLLFLLKKHVDTIENKTSDSQTWKEKEEAWKMITQDFNAAAIGVPRTHVQLQNKYNILKRNSRKEYANLRKCLNATGGGEYKPTELSDIAIKINNLQTLSINGGSNNADCDGVEVSDCSSMIVVEATVQPPSESTSTLGNIEENINEPVDIEDAGTHDWSNYSPACLKRKKHTALVNNKNSNLSNKSNLRTSKTITQVLSTEKKELIELQKKYFFNLNEKLEEEHSLKINLMKKESDLKLQQAAEEHEWKREEHEMKMKQLNKSNL